MNKFQAAVNESRREIGELKQKIARLEMVAMESVWANVFHDATRNSEWLTDKAFCPSGGAICYQTMYVAYRILNDVKPKRILELGLGQSTKLIGQYAAAHQGVSHKVVENNADWISFFLNVSPPPPRDRDC